MGKTDSSLPSPCAWLTQVYKSPYGWLTQVYKSPDGWLTRFYICSCALSEWGLHNLFMHNGLGFTVSMFMTDQIYRSPNGWLTGSFSSPQCISEWSLLNLLTHTINWASQFSQGINWERLRQMVSLLLVQGGLHWIHRSVKWQIKITKAWWLWDLQMNTIAVGYEMCKWTARQLIFTILSVLWSL